MRKLRIALMALSLLTVLAFSGMLAAGRDDSEGLYRALGNLAEVVHLIRTEYVDELNDEALSLSLDAGIVESVDRWAAVLPAGSADRYRELVGAAPAYGLVLGARLGSAAVRQAIPGSPAAAAALEAWEVIERVDGVNTRGRPLWQLRLELRDKEAAGAAVELTVVDKRVDQRREVVLQPATWSPRAGSLELTGGVAVIRVDSLPAGAADQIRELVPGAGPVVLDLRNLAWGFEEQAIAVADLFVDQGALGGWSGRRAGAQAFAATTGSLTARSPVVMIGPETEGVGEILAAALQRGAESPLVGGRTAGHAPHMQFVEDGDVTLWLPVGKWQRADGEPINDNGVEPDEAVEAAGEDEGGDPVLERALELAAEPVEQAA
ncbi:MAG TPA: S41 family peptidase [Thermoanaerobaculales bacterium]|nr:S41 family peptidase [Thermoanaerobaculales bacterium]HPA79840.1 S41 family peptidase [Thermoanaerobaculales bacterium]HQL29803.1 S41 family peptidase [Thermoanaerobaculales bacterium]HQN94859.1 S41 family peptidase [Thermoanaerobaculales bacterium]HQP42973.1 S41 family peptidase [Thermoanaerobaculales bacterium]